PLATQLQHTDGDTRIEVRGVHSWPCYRHHLLDAGLGNCHGAPEAGDLLIALYKAHTSHDVGRILEGRMGQEALHFSVGAVIHHTIVRTRVGVGTTRQTAHANAGALHPELKQGLGHGRRPGTAHAAVRHAACLWHPGVAAPAVVHHDGIATVRGQHDGRV